MGIDTMLELDESVEFADNPEPRCPCILLVDTSGSMSGAPIAALNEGLVAFKNNLMSDSLAARRVEIAVISFDSTVETVCDFCTTDDFSPPTLSTQGVTCMASGILQALDLVDSRKKAYRANGIAYYRPWIFMITDGGPTESDEIVRRATERIKTEEDAKRVAFFAVGVEGADMTKLGEISVRKPVKLNGLDFREMFLWLSASMQRVSQSKVDEQVSLPPAGWGKI